MMVKNLLESTETIIFPPSCISTPWTQNRTETEINWLIDTLSTSTFSTWGIKDFREDRNIKKFYKCNKGSFDNHEVTTNTQVPRLQYEPYNVYSSRYFFPYFPLTIQNVTQNINMYIIQKIKIVVRTSYELRTSLTLIWLFFLKVRVDQSFTVSVLNLIPNLTWVQVSGKELWDEGDT